MRTYEVIDSCPVPSEIAPQVRALKRAVPKAVLQSAYRGEEARGLLQRLGKHTQAYLYAGFLRHLRGFLPANPPGRSTHELFSDAHAYRGPVGRPLAAWQCGLDFNASAVDALIRAARAHGWELHRPYSSGLERHHVNFAKKPRLPKPPRRPVPKHLAMTSIDGIDRIAGFEGVRLEPYRDAVGVWTVGYGHTGPATQNTHLRSVSEAKKLLRRDLVARERAVRQLVKVPLTQHQFDALVSLVYNIGAPAFGASTLLKRLNAKQYARAANQFLRWDQGGGHALPGLTRRRRAERALFLKGSNRGTRVNAARGVL